MTLKGDSGAGFRNSATKVRPLIQRITDTYVSDVAVDITSELFDITIKPVLQEFREMPLLS